MNLKLIARKLETPGVESFIFKPTARLDWKAGQFLHYVVNHAPTDDRGSDRWFTIASAPYEKRVMLTTRFTQVKGSTFKKTLKTLKVGDSIEITGVDGDFTANDLKKDYVFIAGGIGITPFRAILKQTMHDGTPLRVTLLYSSRDLHVIYKNELEALARQNPNLVIHYLFPPKRLDRKTIREIVPNLKKALIYISGPEPMVEEIGKILGKIGVPKNQIKQDWFPGYSAD